MTQLLWAPLLKKDLSRNNINIYKIKLTLRYFSCIYIFYQMYRTWSCGTFYYQGRRKLFFGRGGGGWVKMSATMFDRRRKIKKKHPKAVPQKRNLDQNINDSKCHICNFFFENITSGVQLYSTRSSGHHQILFYSRIYSRKS